MYKKDDLVTVKIIDMTSEGEGIGKADGFPFFIKDAIVGDEVKAKIIKAKKNYAYARLMEIITPSEDRINPPCPIARPCGGCQIQAMSYERQLRFKEQKVINNLVRIGGVDKDYLEKIFEPIIGMEKPWHYRNKAQYPVGRDKDGRIAIGFYAGRTHSVIPCDNCLIGPEHHEKILSAVKVWMEECGAWPFDEKTGKGLVRHVLIRDGFATGQTMVVLVVNCEIDKADVSNGRWKRLAELIFAEGMPAVTSLQLNENRDNTNVILGRKCKVLKGTETIEDVLMGLSFKISPLSFYQVNPVQTEKLYGTAIEFADLTGGEEVWDVCCGIGTITLAVAQEMKKKAAGECRVHGIEIVPAAIENAKENAVRNGISEAEFICAPAEEYMPANRNSIRADVIITDPPRKGMDERSLEVMVSMAPEKIVYVSCDSATLARDVKYLTAHGYELKKVRPCDMFPHSVHVETVVLLTHQRKPDDYLKIHVDLDELDLTKSESKATYEEIRNYVKDKHNMRVTNLYIAQVKRDMGIIERINYNVGDGKAKVPQCPKDKYEAIVDALKHFQMIA